MGPAPADGGLPGGLPAVLDDGTRVVGGGRTLVGGDPPRALRLSPAGAAVLGRLRASGVGEAPAARALARRLTDAGLLHPAPPARRGAAGDVTVVIPVRDRPIALSRCVASAGGPAVVVDDGSRDPAAVAAVCARHGARLVRRAAPGGPGAARNAALELVDTPLVAFLDSDCLATPGWIEALAGHFADPLVAAVAPRVRGEARPSAGALARFAAARSPLDLGPQRARVRPGGRVSYVPTAALLVRRSALGDGFDPRLRYGEDVDLVWRLHDAGWRVRYEPAVTVRHTEPGRWSALLARRFAHGTSAGPLAARHPGRLAPLVVSPAAAAVATLALAGRPRLAAGALAAQSAREARRLRSAGVPVGQAVRWPLRGAGRTATAAGRAGATLVPALLLAAASTRRGRGPAVLLLVGPPLAAWARARPPLDPLRWTALALADDAAYGAGVWVGSARARTVEPLRPVLARAARATPSA